MFSRRSVVLVVTVGLTAAFATMLFAAAGPGKGLIDVWDNLNGQLVVTVKGPFTPEKAKLNQTVKAAFSLTFSKNTVNEESQTVGVLDQRYVCWYQGGGGTITSVRVTGMFAKDDGGKAYDHTFKDLKPGGSQSDSELTATLRTTAEQLVIIGGPKSPVITSIEMEGNFGEQGRKQIWLYGSVLTRASPIRAVGYNLTAGIVVAQAKKPPEVKPKKGSKKGAKGTLSWDVSVRDGESLGNQVIAKFTFTPDKDNPATVITFIQVVTRLTRGDDADTPGGNDDEKYYLSWSVNPKLSDRIDHNRGENDPYYGAVFNDKKWESEVPGPVEGPDYIKALGPMTVGRGPEPSKPAYMWDTPTFGAGRQGLGDCINMFETAAFCVDSQEVLGVISWGYKVPDNKTDPIELLLGTDADFSLSLSQKDGTNPDRVAARKTIAKANEVGPKTLMTHCKLDGSALISKPDRSKVNCGGTSALPD